MTSSCSNALEVFCLFSHFIFQMESKKAGKINEESDEIKYFCISNQIILCSMQLIDRFILITDCRSLCCYLCYLLLRKEILYVLLSLFVMVYVRIVKNMWLFGSMLRECFVLVLYLVL
jgi:hypothetical protein